MTKNYFSHDLNASRDVKVMKLRMKYGWEGYGVWWAIVEALRSESEYKISLDCVEPLIFDLQIKQDIFDYFFECGLLKKDETHFFSESLLKRMGMMNAKADASKQNGKKGGRPPADSDSGNGQSVKAAISGKVQDVDFDVKKWAEAFGVMQFAPLDLAAVSELVKRDCLPEDAKAARLENGRYFSKATNEHTCKLIMTEKDKRLALKKKPMPFDEAEYFHELARQGKSYTTADMLKNANSAVIIKKD